MSKPVFFSEGQLVDEAGVPLQLIDVGNTVRRLTQLRLSAAAAFDFQNLDQTYEHLEIRAWLRSSAAATTDTGALTFNNDTTNANYRNEIHQAWAATPSSSENTGSATARQVLHTSGANSAAGLFCFHQIFLPNYRGGHLKTAQIESQMWGSIASLGFIKRSIMYLWNSTAAINRIGLVPTTTPTTWEAGSQVEIFGHRSSF